MHDYPVLVSVYNVLIDYSGNAEAMNLTKNSLLDTAAAPGVSNDNNASKIYENLLEAVEQEGEHCEMDVVGTVQRHYYTTVSAQNVRKWTLLCEDAFGVFFEVHVDASLTQTKWAKVIHDFEGQRICFHKLQVKGRVTKTQLPKLFTLIESLWDPEGYGLQHVYSSQSTCSESNHVAHVPCPNFCYILSAQVDTSDFTVVLSHSSQDSSLSGINRPNPVNPSVDVLYKPTCVKNLPSVLNCEKSINRFSVFCKIVNMGEYSSMPTRVFVIDHAQNEPMLITVNSDNVWAHVEKGDVVLLKDLCHRETCPAVFDDFSLCIQIKSYDEFLDGKLSRTLHQFTNFRKEVEHLFAVDTSLIRIHAV